MISTNTVRLVTLTTALLLLAGTAAYAIPTTTISGIAVSSVSGSDELTASTGESSNTIIATDALETSCADPEFGGCQFQFTSGTGTGTTLNNSRSDTFTIIYEPDGVTVSDIFGIACDTRDPTTGLCSSGAALAFASRIPGGPGLDITQLPPGTDRFGTEIGGAAGTSFDASFYLNTDSFPEASASFVSANDQVPEPGTLALFGAGLVVMAGIGARYRRRKPAQG